MGRVYNALMRADRWGDSSRPIGGRASADKEGAAQYDGEQKQHAEAPTPTALTRQTPDSQPLFDDSGEIDGFLSASFQQPVIDDLALNQFARDRLAHDHFADERVVSQPEALAAPAPRLHVAPAPPPALPFVEPRQRANVLDLALDPHLAAVASSDDLASERYRTLAVRLINMASKRKLKTLLVTSAQEGEGKSTVAANLSWVMAKAGERRVLLIDADLRRPSAARLLGVKPSGGWLDMTEGRAKLEDAAVRLDPNNLYLLAPQSASWAAGEGASDRGASSDYLAANEALTSSRIEELLKDLERHFDFIVIDAPPILEFADSQRLASIVDGSVMVVRAARTHHEAVTNALKLIPKDHRLGVVLNEAEINEEIAYGNRKKKGRGPATLKQKR